jgi:hypothetical protein
MTTPAKSPGNCPGTFFEEVCKRLGLPQEARDGRMRAEYKPNDGPAVILYYSDFSTSRDRLAKNSLPRPTADWSDDEVKAFFGEFNELKKQQNGGKLEVYCHDPKNRGSEVAIQKLKALDKTPQDLNPADLERVSSVMVATFVLTPAGDELRLDRPADASAAAFLDRLVALLYELRPPQMERRQLLP